MAWTWFHRLASPPHVYRVAGRLTPWLAWPAAALIIAGLIGGLVLAPPDYQQGDGYRIIYVHAPSAWMSLMVYTTMAVAAAIGLIWRMKVAHAVAASCAPIGASFTFAALVTGSLWGAPMWGTYWQWDPRLTSELILLLLYLGYMGLRSAFDDVPRADRVSAVLAVVATQAQSTWSAWGVYLYLAGRLAYLPLYAFGVPLVRSLAWNVATLGIVLACVAPFIAK